MPKPPIEVFSIEELDAPFFGALGEFISTFARAEGFLSVFLRSLSGLPDEEARIIFAGKRNTDIINNIRDLLAISKKVSDEYKLRVARILKQFENINLMRKHVIHRDSVALPDGQAVFHNAFIAKKKGDPHRDHAITYDLSTFKNATNDLKMIWLELESIRFAVFHPHPSGRPDDMGYFLRYTWQYTPVQPKNAN